MLKTIISDLKKSLLSIQFAFSFLTLLVLIFFSACGKDEYSNFNVFMHILNCDKGFWLKHIGFNSAYVFQTGFSSHWLAIFLPIITSFACVPVFCDEYKSNYWRLVVPKTGRKRYLISKYVTCVIVSAIMVIVAFLIFAVACFVLLPTPNEYPKEMFVIPWYCGNTYIESTGLYNNSFKNFYCLGYSCDIRAFQFYNFCCYHE